MLKVCNVVFVIIFAFSVIGCDDDYGVSSFLRDSEYKNVCELNDVNETNTEMGIVCTKSYDEKVLQDISFVYSEDYQGKSFSCRFIIDDNDEKHELALFYEWSPNRFSDYYLFLVKKDSSEYYWNGEATVGQDKIFISDIKKKGYLRRCVQEVRGLFVRRHRALTTAKYESLEKTRKKTHEIPNLD